jgi:hypothetical protein
MTDLRRPEDTVAPPIRPPHGRHLTRDIQPGLHSNGLSRMVRTGSNQVGRASAGTDAPSGAHHLSLFSGFSDNLTDGPVRDALEIKADHRLTKPETP